MALRVALELLWNAWVSQQWPVGVTKRCLPLDPPLAIQHSCEPLPSILLPNLLLCQPPVIFQKCIQSQQQPLSCLGGGGICMVGPKEKDVNSPQCCNLIPFNLSHNPQLHPEATLDNLGHWATKPTKRHAVEQTDDGHSGGWTKRSTASRGKPKKLERWYKSEINWGILTTTGEYLYWLGD